MSNKEKALLPKLRFPEFQEKEGWPIERLGSICGPQQWATISSSDLVEEGYSVYGANGFIGYYTHFNHEFETVAVTCRGSTCGEVTLIPPRSYITGNSMCLDGIDGTRTSHHFIYQALKHRGFKDIISGSAQPQIVGNAIKKIEIAIPKHREQQKIADCLSSLDELITAQARKVDVLKTHKKGLMQQLFPSEGENQPRLRFREFRDAGEWESKPLAKVCKVLQGYGFPEALQGKGEGLYPFCKVSDISRAVAENGGLLVEAANYVGDDELSKLRAKLIPKGATVFASLSESLCVRHSMSTRSMNAKQDKDHRCGGHGGNATLLSRVT